MNLIKHFLMIAGVGLSLIGCEAMTERKDHLTKNKKISSNTSEDGKKNYTQFEVTVENMSPAYNHLLTKIENTPIGKDEGGPIHPGESYEFTFKAGRGHKLSFFTMVAASNDLFISPDTGGIPLYDAEGNPRSGDLTAELKLWDAGTEHNQPLGEGSDQPANRNGGSEDSNKQVRLVEDNSYEGLGSLNSLVAVSLEALEDQTFKVTVRAKDDGLSPLTPVLYTIHEAAHEVFTEGESEKSNGLELLAEQGDPSELAAALKAQTGYASPFSPGLFVVHDESFVLVEEGLLASSGLEELAENGSPVAFKEELESSVNDIGVFNTPEGADQPGVIAPGGKYSFIIMAKPGNKLSMASMLVQSNDWFIASPVTGIELFDYSGKGIEGNLTESFSLYDAGTEADQDLGIGNEQAPRQVSKDGPQDDNDVIRKVDQIDINQYIKVNIKVIL